MLSELEGSPLHGILARLVQQDRSVRWHLSRSSRPQELILAADSAAARVSARLGEQRLAITLFPTSDGILAGIPPVETEQLVDAASLTFGGRRYDNVESLAEGIIDYLHGLLLLTEQTVHP